MTILNSCMVKEFWINTPFIEFLLSCLLVEHHSRLKYKLIIGILKNRNLKVNESITDELKIENLAP
jgi:hypothetical protein